MGRGPLNHLRLGDGLRASSRAVLPLMVVAGLAGDALLSAPEALLDLLTIATLFVWTALIASSPGDGVTPSPGKGRHTGDARPLVFSLFGVATLAGIAIRLVDGPAEVVALALFVVSADQVLRRADRPDETLPAAGLTLLLFAVFLLLELHSAHARFSMDLVARGVSSVVSWLVPGTVSVGAGLLGIRLVVLALLHTLGIAVLGEGADRYRTAALAVGSLAAFSLAYAVGWAWLSELERVQTAAGLLRPLAAPYDFRLLLLMLLAVPLVFARAAIAPRATTRTSDARSHRAAAAVSLGLAAAVLLMSAQAGATGPEHRVIVLDTTGQIEHDVPTYGRYGLENLGQFGMLPRYLQATGLSGEIVDEITPGVLADADTLVILNLRERLDDATRESVWAFVEAGDGLLVAGDHTGAEEIRDPSNHLLGPVGISLGFDSAIPLSDRWASGFEMASHPVFRGIAEDKLQVVIGASLSVAPPARPVLIGRAGYSDAGDMANVEGGYLGDMTYARGERMGDLALAAESSYGRGRVLVFGDTTLFQNLAISRSYRLLDNVFAWLGRTDDADAQRTRSLAGAILLLGAAVALVIAVTRLTIGMAAPALAIAIGMLVSGVLLAPAAPAWESRPFAGRHAVIDISHHELGRLDHASDSLDGLTANLIRAGLQPFFMRDFSEALITDADVIVLPAPTRPFSPAEIAALDESMRGGSLLILTTGAEKPYGSYDLLRHLGYAMGGAPMGRAAVDWNGQRVQFWSAWPLRDESGGSSQTVAEVWDSPVILYQPRGAGGSLVIADAAFLFEKNLEGLNTHDIGNIGYLREILATYTRDGESDE